MKSLKYSEILSRNRELGKAIDGAPYRIALLSNIVVNQLAEILEFQLRSCGINAEVVIGEYDNIVQDSVQFKDVEAAVVFWEAANLVDGFSSRAESMEAGELKSLHERVQREIELVLLNLRDVPLVLFNRYSAMPFSNDDLRDSMLTQFCDGLNSALERTVASHQLIIGVDKILAQVGLHAAVDFRQFQSSRALYSVDFLKAYADHVQYAFRAVLGRTRKVLVMDCDNTLWGGVLGEDGETQIQMSDATRPGKIFREIQQLLKGLREQGVLLALCSKNNPEDVDRILNEHPDMLLRENNWVSKKVNWQDKATNLREMAAELNLGLDSFVFVDDSAFELGLVQDELPQVTCVRVPENLSEYPTVIRHLKREFFVLSQTAEDSRRTEMYRQEQTRSETIAQFTSLDGYLQSLELVIRIAWGDSVSVARAAQLTQKTNQFNLTTRRYTEADIARMLAGSEFTVAAFSVADRYGDYGITGLAIAQRVTGSEVASIDSLLLSCRVIGRNVERVFFDKFVSKLQTLGVVKLQAEYSRTQKNDQVAGFYDALGFRTLVEETGLRKYDLTIANYRPSGIDYIEVMEDVS